MQISGCLVDRRGIDVVHDALRAHDVAVDRDLERRLGHAAAAECRFVHEHHVGEIEQVVDQQLVVALDVDGAVHAGPAGFDVLAEVRNQRRIGERRVAEPDEDQPMHFAHREAAGTEIAADRRAPGTCVQAPSGAKRRP